MSQWKHLVSPLPITMASRMVRMSQLNAPSATSLRRSHSMETYMVRVYLGALKSEYGVCCNRRSEEYACRRNCGGSSSQVAPWNPESLRTGWDLLIWWTTLQRTKTRRGGESGADPAVVATNHPTHGGYTQNGIPVLPEEKRTRGSPIYFLDGIQWQQTEWIPSSVPFCNNLRTRNILICATFQTSTKRLFWKIWNPDSRMVLYIRTWAQSWFLWIRSSFIQSTTRSMWKCTRTVAWATCRRTSLPLRTLHTTRCFTRSGTNVLWYQGNRDRVKRRVRTCCFITFLRLANEDITAPVWNKPY